VSVSTAPLSSPPSNKAGSDNEQGATDEWVVAATTNCAMDQLHLLLLLIAIIISCIQGRVHFQSIN
jgi:hypothetical protein